MRTMVIVFLLSALAGCASFSADAGKFDVSGYSGDPKGMTKVLGQVRVEQYRAETCRLYVAEAMKRGRPVSPTVCDSIQENTIGFPGAYGYGYGVTPEGSFYGYNGGPSILDGSYMPVDLPAGAAANGYATQEQLQRTDATANEALRGVKVIVRKHAETEEQDSH